MPCALLEFVVGGMQISSSSFDPSKTVGIHTLWKSKEIVALVSHVGETTAKHPAQGLAAPSRHLSHCPKHVAKTGLQHARPCGPAVGCAGARSVKADQTGTDSA
eukprot:1007406-Amphidinium_carterae.1